MHLTCVVSSCRGEAQVRGEGGGREGEGGQVEAGGGGRPRYWRQDGGWPWGDAGEAGEAGHPHIEAGVGTEAFMIMLTRSLKMGS